MFGFPQHVGSDGSEDNTGLRNVRDPFREDCLYFVNSSSRIFIRRSYDFNSSLETSFSFTVKPLHMICYIYSGHIREINSYRRSFLSFSYSVLFSANLDNS